MRPQTRVFLSVIGLLYFFQEFVKMPSPVTLVDIGFGIYVKRFGWRKILLFRFVLLFGVSTLLEFHGLILWWALTGWALVPILFGAHVLEIWIVHMVLGKRTDFFTHLG